MTIAKTWRLDLGYDGSEFKGWARQPEMRTVQSVLEGALATVLREPVRLSVAGRTDAGVHAAAQVASFVSGVAIDESRLRRSLNAILPEDVVVFNVGEAPRDFVARQAKARTYRYRISLTPAKPLFERRYVWHLRRAVDFEALTDCAALLVGRRDFAALTPSAHLYHCCVREVTAASWRLVDDECWFEIRATSFLHNMVRVAVGSMVDVAVGRLTKADLERGLLLGRRSRLGRTAPPQGLSLIAVEYD